MAAIGDVMTTMDRRTTSVMHMTANDERIVVTLRVHTTRTTETGTRTETIETDMIVAKITIVIATENATSVTAPATHQGFASLYPYQQNFVLHHQRHRPYNSQTSAEE